MRRSFRASVRTSVLVCLGVLIAVVAACGEAEIAPQDGMETSSDEPSEPPSEMAEAPDEAGGPAAEDDAVADEPDEPEEQPGQEAPPLEEVDDEPAFEPPLAKRKGPAFAPDPFDPYVLADNEALPNAKRLASDVVQALTTYGPDDSREDIAVELVGEEGLQDLIDVMAPIHHEGAWSVGEIVYPQLGGATNQDASVMVVVRQTVGLPDGSVLHESRTMDVRLEIVDGVWELEALDSVGGKAIDRPSDLSDAAITVVDSDRIEMPDTARWDIYSGRVQESLLELMVEMAEHVEYGVIVLDEGHPLEVWGRDHLSQHTRGLAVDLYHVDGVQVIDGRADDSSIYEFVRWLYDREDVRKIGGPWALDPRGGRSFTDLIHQDHLHIESYADGEERHDPDEAQEMLLVD